MNLAGTKWESLGTTGPMEKEDTLDGFIMRDRDCPYYDHGHSFDMVTGVSVLRDTNLAFTLACGCTVAIADPFGASVIEVAD